MPLSQKLLGTGEELLVHMHPDARHLLPRALGAAAVVFLAVLGVVALPARWQPLAGCLVVAVGAGALIAIAGWAWLQWDMSTVGITNRRIITRRGVFTKLGHDLPLAAVARVDAQPSGTGTSGSLLVTTTSGATVTLRRIANLPAVTTFLNTLLDKRAGEGIHTEASRETA
ncbi:PH domain-containing protein [Actinotignum timonense]|uniref:PH domain-containing protein n=1 Tax=Actinotignum timonense TaxID=1870995 RepID=UPI002A822416|nr:PH domain-containing protein [Actinotignum timonense]MDY5158995.1 PH domain-containing protein [Actinotignum timonense]